MFLPKIKFPGRKKKDLPDDVGGDVADEQAEVQDARGLPSITKGMKLQARFINYMLVGGAAIVVLFLMYKYYSDFITKRKETSQKTVVNKKIKAQNKIVPLKKPLLKKPDPPPLKTGLFSATSPHTPTARTTAPTHSRKNGEVELTPAQIVDLRKKSGDLKLSFGDQDTPSAVAPQKTEVNTPRLLSGVKASLIPDLNMFMTKGTLLDCTLDQAIDTSLGKGPITCHLAQDGLSTNGLVNLLEKGTKIVGSWKAEIKGSSGRLFVLWDRAETPTGVVMRLDSEGMDGLGRAGVTGFVDTHFWDKFSQGMLISVIGDLSASMTQSGVSGDSNSISYTGTTNGFTSMATEAVKNSADIPNTLKRNQGAVVKIFVAQDLDFRSVYSLETTDF